MVRRQPLAFALACFLGTWRSTNLKTWKQSHSLMWPEMQVPELLVPLSVHSKVGDENELRHFQEATLPTSILWACLVSQSSSPKRTVHQRLMAATTFYEIIMAVFRAGDMELQVQWGEHFTSCSSCKHGGCGFHYGFRQPLAEPAGNHQERMGWRLSGAWFRACTCFEIVGCVNCASNSLVGRKQNLDDCLGTSH